jgi:glycosyltransferase involved in cell wall biosynthesis
MKRRDGQVRVLLLAEAANPQWVSVPLVGWSHARALMQHPSIDAHLVTQVRNRDAIASTGLVEGREFTALDTERTARLRYRLGCLLGGSGTGWTTHTALASLAYWDFERTLWRSMGSRICQGEFDIVHRITPLSPTTPSPIAGKCRSAGVPFILGPLNGGVPWPGGFDRARCKEREWLSYIRDMYRLLPGYRATRRDASAILVGSRDTAGQMPIAHRRKCFYIPENAINPEQFPAGRTRSAGRPLHAVFCGRLVPYKGADILLEAAAPLLSAGAMTLQIIGEGPQRPVLEDLIRRHALEHHVRLLGWVDHERLHEYLADADVLTFPSIREFGGAVVLEAMAVGVTPVVMNYGGPREFVSDQTGVLIDMAPRDQIIRQLRHELSALTASPERVDRLGARAMEVARSRFTWQVKAQQVFEVYRWSLGLAPLPATAAFPAHPVRKESAKCIALAMAGGAT